MEYSIVKIIDSADIGGRSFVGVSNELGSDKTSIVVPYGVNLPTVIHNDDKENIRFLKRYVRVIQKALNSNTVRRNLDESAEGIQSPKAAVNLIHDYLSFGQYVEYNTEEVISDSCNIDFKKTFKKVTPLIVGNSFVYDRFVLIRKVVRDDDFVSLVQCNVINHFMNHGGVVLLGISLSIPVKTIVLNKTTVVKLQKELSNTFNSRKQSIIRWCITYIRGIENLDPEKGHWDYAIIASTLWEVMVDAVFGNQKIRNKSKYGTRYSFYSIKDKHSTIYGSPTEHDTIFEDDNDIFIVDSKMYGWQKNLLKEEVLGKQFGYYLEAKQQKPEKRIVNILFLPLVPENLDVPYFQDEIIIDPHFSVDEDPDRIIFIFKYPVEDLIDEYYLGVKKSRFLKDCFNEFVSSPTVRKFLDKRKSTL